MLENPQHARLMLVVVLKVGQKIFHIASSFEKYQTWHGAGGSSSWINHKDECGYSEQSATKLFNKLVAPWLAWEA